MPKVNSTLKAADPWLKWLIMAGTVTYFVEITTGISEGNSGHSVFWWVQSFIAVCFTTRTKVSAGGAADPHSLERPSYKLLGVD